MVAHTPHSSYPILYPPIHIISHHYLTLLSNSVIIAMFCYQLSLVCLNERRISHFVLILILINSVSFWNIFPTSKAALNVMTLFSLLRSAKREPFSASHRMCTSFLCISPPSLKMLLRFTENLQTSESSLFNLIPGGALKHNQREGVKHF